jgi:hypothetical protein
MVFVVFPRPAAAPSRDLPAPELISLATLDGSWQLGFPPGLGAPDQLSLPALAALSTHDDPGVRFFSGTVTYSRNLEAQSGWRRDDARTVLDLGAVGDIAEVMLNGEALGVLWKPPWVVDITDALRTGRNALEIRVTNQWTNRIVGDRSVPAADRVLSDGAGSGGFGGPPTSLPASGLLGPVRVLLQTDGE